MTEFSIYQPGEHFSTEKALTHLPPEYCDDESLYDKDLEVINVGSKVEDPKIAMLSNFSESPFDLDGIYYGSVEGFIQSLKESDPALKDSIALKSGYKAKKAGKVYKGLIDESYEIDEAKQVDDAGVEPVGYVTTYQDIQIPFRSPEHFRLIERAIRAKFDQNPECMEALLSTGRHRITHVLNNFDGTEKPESPTTSLPAEAFTTILMKLRNENSEKS